MASPIVKGNNFGATDTVTNTTLNNIVDNAAFKDFDGSTEAFNVSGSTDIGTCALAGGLGVKTTTGQLQLKSQANLTALGNVSGGAAVPTAVAILDEDNMASDSATSLATQQSIKKYVDDNTGLKSSTATGTLSVSNNNAFAQTDLSSVVGSNKAMVIMEISNSSRLSDWIFRTPGSTVNALSGHSGANSVQSSTGSSPLTGGTIVVITNSSGVIEYRAISASGTTTASYSIQAFQKIT
tara:strand:+ start:25 stop:741 length:717 start_codon:yes stop_codon:yes gene_type:complete